MSRWTEIELDEKTVKRYLRIAERALREYPSLANFSNDLVVLRAVAAGQDKLFRSCVKNATSLRLGIAECVRLLLLCLEEKDTGRLVERMSQVICIIDLLFKENLCDAKTQT